MFTKCLLCADTSETRKWKVEGEGGLEAGPDFPPKVSATWKGSAFLGGP